jgi:hypothetical protein
VKGAKSTFGVRSQVGKRGKICFKRFLISIHLFPSRLLQLFDLHPLNSVHKKYSYAEKIWLEEALAAFPIPPPPHPKVPTMAVVIHDFIAGTVEQLSFQLQ